MKKFAIHCTPGVIHCLMTFVFLKIMLSSTNSNLLDQFILVLSILFLINVITYALIAKGNLRILSKHIFIYTLFAALMFYQGYTANLFQLSIEGILEKSLLIYTVLFSYSLAIAIFGALIGAAVLQLIKATLRYQANRVKKNVQW